MITVTGLSKSYNGKKVVDDLSFTMKEGKLFALLGSNGAGKSTTIKMMLSLVKKTGEGLKSRRMPFWDTPRRPRIFRLF